MDKLTPFEREAIETHVSGDHPVLAGLRTQLARGEVSKRESSRVGFFTTLAVPTDIPSVPVRRGLDLSDVRVEMDGMAHGLGLVLFVNEGRLALLEGFTYDDPWPDEIANYRIKAGGVTHLGGSPTDLEQVDAAWIRPGTLT